MIKVFTVASYVFHFYLEMLLNQKLSWYYFAFASVYFFKRNLKSLLGFWNVLIVTSAAFLFSVLTVLMNFDLVIFWLKESVFRIKVHMWDKSQISPPCLCGRWEQKVAAAATLF